jgi:hypothetical protein
MDVCRREFTTQNLPGAIGRQVCTCTVSNTGGVSEVKKIFWLYGRVGSPDDIPVNSPGDSLTAHVAAR